MTAARLREEENRCAAEHEEDKEELYNNELVVEAGASDEERRDEAEDNDEEEDKTDLFIGFFNLKPVCLLRFYSGIYSTFVSTPQLSVFFVNVLIC